MTYLYSFVLFLYLLTFVNGQSEYNLGVGIADITGPAADVGLMGYGELDQVASGVHFRLYARSFIISDGVKNIVIVICDLGGISTLVKMEVSKLAKTTFRGKYTEENILLAATHTHSGPGGYYQHVLYNLGSGTGFVKENFRIIVQGIIQSIKDADEMASTTKGSIMFNEGKLVGAGVNRSPTSYLKNPPEERSKYDGNSDSTFHVLKFMANEKPIGMLSFFAVHATSMNNTNKLISGDNKGYASMLFEAKMNQGSLPGKGPFVAAFATANEGDVSPNLQGAKCIDTGNPCDPITSTCSNKNTKCIAQGPGKNMFDSVKIVGRKQYQRAQQLFDSATARVSGPIDFVHQTVDMSKFTIEDFRYKNTTTTCKPAMGYSFAAGTTDGVGASFFRQGDTTGSPFWNVVRVVIKNPSKKLIQCQTPKPILVASGELNNPYAWQPAILPTQIFRLGQYLITALPAEFTTMSGRRIREVVKDHGPGGTEAVMLAGLANAYSSYVTTPEEYTAQRYEAASTAYGINTLPAYMKQFGKLAKFLKDGKKPAPGPTQPNLMSKQISITMPVIMDTTPRNKEFGDILLNAQDEYPKGAQVIVKFQSANPRNMKPGSTFLTINKKEGPGWNIIATDANWETRFFHRKTNSMLGQSEATIVWDIPKDTPPGKYKICHYGLAKMISQGTVAFNSCSKQFTIK